MKDTNLTSLFQQYLDKKLSSSEDEAFRLRLQTEAEIRKLYISYLLKHLKSTDTVLAEDRIMISEVYANLEPVRMEAPKKIYLFQRYTAENWPKMAVAASLLLLIVFSVLLYNSEVKLSGNNYAEFMVEPISMERASATELPATEKASYFYFKAIPDIDSLEAIAKNCPSFCIVHYYLAHAYLKTKQLEKANQQFEQCLLHIDFLNRVPQLQGNTNEIKFNLLITKALLNKNDVKVLPQLDALIKELNPKDSLYKKAVKFRNSM